MPDPGTPRVAVIVALPAGIDDGSADEAFEQVCAALAADTPVVIADFTATVFCDRAALRRLLAVQRQAAARQAQLRVVAPLGTPASRILEMTGLDKLLPVYRTAYHAAADPWRPSS